MNTKNVAWFCSLCHRRGVASAGIHDRYLTVIASVVSAHRNINPRCPAALWHLRIPPFPHAKEPVPMTIREEITTEEATA